MARRKRTSKKKITKKEIIAFCLVAVLVIAVLVILTTDNPLKVRIINFLEQAENEQGTHDKGTTAEMGTGEFNPSILSGKGNIILPDYFDTNNLLEIHFVDIGQGEAIVINFPDGKTMLIDSGTSTTGLNDLKQEYLEYLTLVTDNDVIEYMVITHADADHYNMMKQVVENYQVMNAYYNQDEGKAYNQFLDVLASEEGITLNEIDNESITYVVEGVDYKVTIFCSGDSAFKGSSERNNQSFICLLEYGGRRILFTGDAGTSTEKWFIEEIESPYIDIDVLKVGHHGSDTSTSQEFLEFIDTEYAVISCDDGTLYGHPDDVVMERLSSLSIATYLTNKHGNILLYIDGDGDFGFLIESDSAVENNLLGIDDRKISIAK
jgi:beta-lactamase superfamily II metal-dependent hydrolase